MTGDLSFYDKAYYLIDSPENPVGIKIGEGLSEFLYPVAIQHACLSAPSSVLLSES